MRKTIMFVFSAVFALALISLPACGKNPAEKAGEKIAGKALEAATGGKAKVDVGSSVDLSGLPAHLRYSNAKAIASWTINEKESKGTYYGLETADPVPTVKAFYKQNQAGWKESMTMDNADASMLTYISPDEKQSAIITITADKEKNKTVIAIVYTQK